ncbi:hypothetical protein [Viridibacterium curvum]|uniref:Lipoprotein n=1 Tax=Viridibacterium curvum TaxID=1101404 RepID=A0ABP9QNS7_9RHOO
MKQILLILLLAALTACASAPKPAPSFVPLPEAARAQLKGVEVLIGVGQQEIEIGNPDYAWLPLQRSGQYGLLSFGGGAQLGIHARASNGQEALFLLAAILTIGLVGSAVGLVVGTGEAGVEGYQQMMANRAAAPLQRSAAGFDFGQRFSEALTGEGGPQVLLKNGQISFVQPATPQNFEAFHAMSAHDAVLIVNMRYAMSTDLNTLVLKTEASLIPKSDAMWRLQYEAYRKGQRMDKLPGKLQTDPLHALYRRVLRYEARLPVKQGDREKAAMDWVKDDARLLLASFNEGLEATARALAADLSGREPAGNMDKAGVTLLQKR